MNVLGIDPGIRNIGFYRWNDNGENGSIRRTLRCPRKWAFERCLEEILSTARDWIRDYKVDVVAVEEVVWRRRRGMLPLAHVAGAVVGLALSMGKVVYLLTPAQKGKEVAVPKGWSQHEVDAQSLARVAYHAERVPSAATASIQRRRLAISAAGSARSNPLRNGKVGKK